MTNTNNTPATATVNFRAPFKVHIPVNVKMPVAVNFNAPINLTYNGASEVKPELPKITAEDLQRYICEQLEGQCETVNPRPGAPAAVIKPAPKSCSAPTKPNVPTDKPVAKKETSCGVAEASVENRILDAIVGKFGVPRNWLISITPFKSCYNMYAVGTTGDLTYLAWVHSDGRITVKQQAW